MRALFEASGVIRVDTVGDLFDVALLLTSQPLPAGRPGRRRRQLDRARRAGRPTRCAAEGLPLARLDDVGVEAQRRRRSRRRSRDALADDEVDAVVVVFVPPLQRTAGEEVALAVRAVAAAASGKPVLSTFLGFEGVPAGLAAGGPSRRRRAGRCRPTPSPERAVRALARAVRYAAWRRRDARRRAAAAPTSTSRPARDVVARRPGRDAGRPAT